MLFNLSMEVWVFIGLGVLVIMLLMSFLASLYRKVGHTRRWSFTGFAANA